MFGCVENYGRLRYNNQITLAFENDLLLSRHEYYYMGLDYVPIAIVGVDDSYKFEAKFWRKIDFNIIRLDQLADQMLSKEGYSSGGFRIVDSNGKQIGVWYSSLHWAAVKIEEDSSTTVLSPELPMEKGRQ
jgi:hypothetical protein